MAQPSMRAAPRTKRIIGLSGSATAWVVAERASADVPTVVICPSRRGAEELSDDITFFLGARKVLNYPAWETLPLEPVSPSVESSAQRIRTRHAIWSGSAPVVVTSAEAVLQRVVPRTAIEALSALLKPGDVLDRDFLTQRLLDGGFQPCRSVERVGEMSIKGAVIDLFPSTSPLPVRLELRGDTVVRLQTFDPDSQRSVEALSSVTVLPVRELGTYLFHGSNADVVTKRLKERAAETSTPPREVEKLLQAIESRTHYPGLELVQYAATPLLPTFFDELPGEADLFLVDSVEITKTMEEYLQLARERADRFTENQHLVPRPGDVYVDGNAALEQIRKHSHWELATIDISTETGSHENIRSEPNVDLSTRMRTSVGSGHAFKPLRDFLDEWRSKRYSIAFAVGSAARAQRLQNILLDVGTDAPIVSAMALGWASSPRRPGVAIIVGHMNTGFRLPSEKLVFVSENEVFGERSYRTGTRPRISAKRLLSTLSLLKEGDFVVHVDYGIGVYQGLKHLTVEGVLGDFLQIDYADSRLYLPAHQIGKIQKFVAAEGQSPAIDKLGSTRWFRTKQKIKDSIVTLAGDLIRLYASRSVVKGWRFEPAGAEDERFADTFPYDETPDQRKAITETLNDMAADKAMDRLVCGDVGFGKTEVAIRAAFKCTQHARQVAVLVPTTILVEQHRKNFAERFAGYPVKVGAVSRFYPAAENQKTLEAVARGEIDIVIGTHRLLQPDIQFSDLGLLIIDEEHRFGVKQKEKLRSLRSNVDVLTLTATPIPRTLHMSLLGIRDISLIQTAPIDRKVIQTFVAEKDETIVRDAILRELRRGGQSFFIHNRVQNIALVKNRLAELVPEARFEFAHGQMTETVLESIMKRFVEREIDVLISTTIIESGLDVPNANTIIIDRADQFGLAQLYQLRGRVGRGKRQAYAYFLVPHVRSLSTEAQERLKVLQSLDSLGVGFNLAIRDLEIRGAGNLLGKEQSGNVLSVGFDMYCKILQEAVADLRGEEPLIEDVVDPDVRVVGLDAFIPEAYVPDIGERLVLYQRLSNLRSDEEAADIAKEIEDRFGPMSEEVDNLMLLMRYRGLLRRHGVVKAEISPVKASITFSPLALLRDGNKATPNTRVDGLKALRMVQQHPKQYRFGKGNTFTILFDEPKEITFLEVFRMTQRTLGALAYTT
jgi:transcription-repair coupling factor (superfamily II helicase)